MDKQYSSGTSTAKTSGKILLRISTKDFIISVICFVLSRAKFLTYMNPFGMAAYAALFTNTGWFYAMLCTGAGVILSKGDYTSVRYLLALGVATPIFGIWDKHTGTFFRASVMSLAYFGVSLCLLLAEGFLIYDFIYFSFEAFICFVCVYLIDGTVPLIQSYKSRTRLTSAEVTSIAALAAMAVLACWSVPPLFGMNLASLLGIFIILAINLEGDCALGAAVGVVMGLVISMGSYESASVVGAYALASFMSGLFKKYSRLGVLLGFTLANAVVTAFLNDTYDMLINPIEVLIAGTVFVTLPARTMHIFTDFVKKAGSLSAAEHNHTYAQCHNRATLAEHTHLSSSLQGLSDIYSQNSRRKRPGKRYINNLFNKCADNVCSGCGLRFGCWQSTGHNNYSYMTEMLDYARHNGHLDTAHLPKKFADRCIKKEEFVKIFNLTYDIYRADKLWLDKTCLLHKLMATQLSVAATAVENLQKDAVADTDPDMSSNLEGALDKLGYCVKNICVRKDSGSISRITVEYNAPFPTPQQNIQIADVISGVVGHNYCYSRSITDTDDLCISDYRPWKNYSVRATALQMQKEGECICGDCYGEIYDRKGNYTAVISDGMGSGIEAHNQARTTVDMLTNLTNTGADMGSAAEMINSSLVIRSHKDCFATLDILYADLDCGTIDVSKTGAAPTYIKTPLGVSKLECNTLPVGILHEVQSQSYKCRLDTEGIIVMISDGISNTVLRSQKNTDWIYKCIEDTKSVNTDALANHILNTAIAKCGGMCTDDMTVIVVYIHKNE